MRKIILIATMALITACSSHNDAVDALSKAGYTNITTNGYAFFTCSEDDFYHTKFNAVNPMGTRVDGVVCSGFLFKGATIRF